MKVSQNVVDLMNRQVGLEFGAMITYFALATRFGQESLPELHRQLSKLAERKKENAVCYLEFVARTGQNPKLPTVPSSEPHFGSTEETVKFALEKEVEGMEQLSRIAHAAKVESDQTTWNFLQEPIKAQEEEILLMRELLGWVQKAGEDNLLLVEDFLIRKTSVAVEV